jgi:hypothetical protein
MKIGTNEGVVQETSDSILMLSKAGASGLASQHGTDTGKYSTKAQALKPDANTNLAYQRTLIPVIARDVERDIQAGEEFVFITRVFAISATANCNRRVSVSLEDRWADRPLVLLSGSDEQHDCIILDS